VGIVFRLDHDNLIPNNSSFICHPLIRRYIIPTLNASIKNLRDERASVLKGAKVLSEQESQEVDKYILYTIKIHQKRRNG
jgi:hypothetical protein